MSHESSGGREGTQGTLPFRDYDVSTQFLVNLGHCEVVFITSETKSKPSIINKDVTPKYVIGALGLFCIKVQKQQMERGHSNLNILPLGMGN